MMKLSLGPSADDFINLAMSSLTDRERESLVLKFGLGGRQPMTYQQIGNEFGNVSRERVRQIVMKALRKLRHPCRIDMLIIARECYTDRARSYAICRNRPPEWCMCKYHGWSEE